MGYTIQHLRDMEKGDVPGHPFHGNQYTDGIGLGEDKTVELSHESVSAALATMNPRIASDYEQRVRHSWGVLQANPKYAADPYRAGGDWDNFQHLALVKPYIENVGGSGRNERKYEVNAEKLKVGAEAYAKEASQEWHGKIVAKVGELSNAKLHYGSGTSFDITGERDGKRINIMQQMILNVSARGKVFNQFPARITIDGKAVSEKKYKETFGGA